jgi:hypothetical protein
MGKTQFVLSAALLAASAALPCQAVVVDFTGGTVTRLDASTPTTNNTVVYDNVDYYDEGGFRLDFLPNSGSTGFSTHVGDYYEANNDVIHSHWFTGDFGQVAIVRLTKIGGGTFDLNYFILTSNTDTGEGAASGLEVAFVQGFNSSVPTGPAVLLPSEDWGFPASQIYLGSDFDAVDEVIFNVANAVDCFGMDEFYIDQPAPAQVPEPASLVSMLGAIGLVTLWHRRRSIGG